MADKPLSIPKLSFTGGEWAPNLHARTDLAKYTTAVKEMKNFFVHPHGPVSNRSGLKFIAETKDSSKQSRLRKFQFNTEQKYLLEFGEEYMRVLMDDGLILETSGSGTNICNSTAYQWTVSPSDADEYYLELSGGGDPGFAKPDAVYEDADGVGTSLPEGTMGSLAVGEWDYGDNDTLGWSTIYVRLTDDVDPDTKDAGYLEAAYAPVAGYATDINTTGYRWRPYNQGGGVDVYYMTTLFFGNPGLGEPEAVYEDADGTPNTLAVGSYGSLAVGEWCWHSCSLGYDTIWVRITDDVDPDSKANGYLEGAYIPDAGDGDDITGTGLYRWIASGDEYYFELIGGGDPGFDEPENIFEDVGGADTTLVEGTLGSLAVGEWSYGDNDALGFDTIYVRLTDDVDPDTKAHGYLEAGYIEEIATPYQEADLFELSFTQSADTLYIDHPNYAPRKLTRTAHDKWRLTVTSFGTDMEAPENLATDAAGTGDDFEYAVTAVSTTGEESLISNVVTASPGDTLTWDAVSEAHHYNVYKDRDRCDVYGWIGDAIDESFEEPLTDDTGISADFSKSPPEAQTPFDVAGDYPGVCAFYEQRVIHARTNNAPQTLQGSRTGSFDNFNTSRPSQADDSYQHTINAHEVNEIFWLVPMNQGLVIGTSGAEWRMTGAGQNEAVTPASINVRNQSDWGSKNMPPLKIGNTILFVQNSGNAVRDLVYDLNVDGYTGNDLTVMANHLFKGLEIVDWSYQQFPDSVIWCIRNDGVLLGLTYYREHEVWGWHQHETEGLFESACCIGNEEGVGQQYFIVNRTINGSTARYIEKLSERLPVNIDFEYDVQDAFFVDSGLTLDSPLTITGATAADPVVITSVAHGLSDGDLVDIVEVLGMTELNGSRYKIANKTDDTFELTDEDDNDIDGSAYTAYVSRGKARKAVTTISGLDHLEGEDVVALADGNVVGSLTVSSGSVTLTTAASRVHIGLAYTSDLDFLDFIYSAADGTIQDKHRELATVLLVLDNTKGISVGTDADNLEEIPFRAAEGLNDASGLFSGTKEQTINLPDKVTNSGLFIRNANPVPVTITGVFGRVKYGD